MQTQGLLIFAAALVFFAFVMTMMSFKIIRPFEKGLVERFGKYQRTLNSGLNIIIPFLDTVVKIDMREIALDVPSQMVITKDNVGVEVDAVIFAQVIDPVKTKYEIGNYILAATKLAQTNLRNIIGEMELAQLLTLRDIINTQLRDVLDTATDKWGVRVNRVKIRASKAPAERGRKLTRNS